MAERMSYERSISVLTAFVGESSPTRFDSLDAFRSGYCAIYAAALLRAHQGWTVMSVGAGGCAVPDPEDCDQYGQGICMCCVDHFYAVTPEGWLVDAYGEHDPEAIDWGILLPISDEVLACVLESWHWGEKDVEGIAAWAIELASS